MQLTGEQKVHSKRRQDLFHIDLGHFVMISPRLLFSSLQGEWRVDTIQNNADFYRPLWDKPDVSCTLQCACLCYTWFVGNFFLFTAVQEFLKSVKIWQSYRHSSGPQFFWTQCRLYYVNTVQSLPRCLWLVLQNKLLLLLLLLLSAFV